MPFPNWIGKKRLWIRERVLAALARAMQEIPGSLPISDRKWYQIKKGRLDLPPASRIYEFFHSFPVAWQAAGADRERISRAFSKWTTGDDEYLKENAGKLNLEQIAEHLDRSYLAVRGRLRFYGICAKYNQGYLSAAELSKEFKCSYHRIRKALAKGLIKGHFDSTRNQWQVDLAGLTPEALVLLSMPKRTHKTQPTDMGDYYRRHNLARHIVDGRIVVISLVPELT